MAVFEPPYEMMSTSKILLFFLVSRTSLRSLSKNESTIFPSGIPTKPSIIYWSDCEGSRSRCVFHATTHLSLEEGIHGRELLHLEHLRQLAIEIHVEFAQANGTACPTDEALKLRSELLGQV